MHKTIQRLVLGLFLGVMASGAVAATSPATGFFPLKIVNGSHIADDSEVYVFAKASLPGAEGTETACVMAIDQKTGRAECKPVDASTDLTQYSYPLSVLPADQNDPDAHDLYLPKVISGRIYFSIGYPLYFYVKGDGTVAQPYTIPDPDGFNTRDPNYYVLYDKIEFSYTDAGTWINPTAVDFFSIPIGISQPSAAGIKQAGFSTSTRAQILGAAAQLFADAGRQNPPTNAIWNRLILQYQGAFNDQSTGVSVLRLMSPGKAMETAVLPGMNPPFDQNYLENDQLGLNYIQRVWNYYQSNTVSVDCSELKGNPNAVPLDNYIFTGKVNAEGDFVFTNATRSATVTLNKPNTLAFFAGATGAFDAPNNTPKAIIVRELTSAFEVGLLPAPPETVLKKSYFQANQGDYYTVNERLGPDADTTGPWYDLYSKALHQIGGADQPIYTFAYDDALGQDGTLHDPNAQNIGAATITLGDMWGTRIPDPTFDTKKYQVTVTLGQNSSKQYYPLVIDGKIILPGAPSVFKEMTIPIQANFAGRPIKIYVEHPMVVPYSELNNGIVVVRDQDQVTLSFPGPPS